LLELIKIPENDNKVSFNEKNVPFPNYSFISHNSDLYILFAEIDFYFLLKIL